MAIAIGLLKTLLELSRSKKSGALEAKGGGARARIFVEDGVIVFADEGTIGETLGRILVREGLLTEEQYNAALEKMAELTAKGERKRLGEILLEMKVLTRVQLDAALSAQVRQKVVRAIGWGASSFKLVESHGPLDVVARFATPLEPLVLAALRLAPEEHVEELLDLALTRYPALRGDGSPGGGVLRADTLKRVEAFGFQPAERALALSLDGSRTSAEILGAASEVDALVVLTALLLTDLLDLHGAPRAARRAVHAAKGPSKAPTIRKLAGSSAAPRAIAAAEKKPERPVTARLKAAQEAKKSIRPPPASVSGPAEPEERRGDLAVWNRAPTSEPLASVNRLVAEQAFQAGKAHVRANDMKSAAAELSRAASLFPAIEYELWAAWTSMRADKENEGKHVAEVRALAEKAIEQDPSLGFAYFVLGHLALQKRDAPRARELFAKARALDPATTSDARDVRFKPATAAAEPKDEAKTSDEAKDAPGAAAATAEELDAEPIASSKAAPAPAPKKRRTLLVAAIAALVLVAVAVGWSRRRADGERVTDDAGAIFPSAPDSDAGPP